jgi:hypothetical protein
LSFATIILARYGGAMPCERVPFTPSSILVRPHQKPPANGLCGLWWRRRVPPPGPKGLLRYPFIAIAGEPAKRNIDTPRAVGKPPRLRNGRVSAGLPRRPRMGTGRSLGRQEKALAAAAPRHAAGSYYCASTQQYWPAPAARLCHLLYKNAKKGLAAQARGKPLR